MAKSNLIKNIPPKARFMLVTVILVTGVAVFAFFNMMGGPSQEVGDSVAGDVRLQLNPSEHQIDKSRPDEESIIPEGSPLDNELKRIRESEIKSAKSSDKSFIDELRVKNEDRVVEDIDRKINNNSNENVSGIDDILQKRRQEKENENFDLQERKKMVLEKSREQNPQNNVAQRQAKGQTSLFEEDKWLSDQLGGISSYSYGDSEAVSAIANTSRAMGDYGQSKSNREVSQKNDNGAQSGNGNGNNNDSYVSSFIRKPSQLPDMDLDQLDADRQLAGQSRSAPGGGYQNEGGSSQGQNRASAYEESVYPTGMSPESGGAYVPSGTIYYAVLEIGVNSDEISPVRALVVQEGPMKNAILVGAPERVGEKVVISFNSMSIDGQEYSINAVALDPATMRTAIADDVDTHVFERYFKLATAAALAGYAEALTSTSTTKFSDGSEQQTQDSIPRAEDQVAVAVGRVGEQMIPIFEKEFGRAPTVKVYPNRDLGIMLMNGIQLQ